MIGSYRDSKDLYATIATGVYNNTYWDNMEKHEDGSPNPEGKKRRGSCKSILLGLMYGRGNASIASQIGSSLQEANKIIEDFYNGFPKVKQWMDKTVSDAKVTGYVEDFWGRRRRLPDIQLPQFDIRDKSRSKNSVDVNPLLGSKGLVQRTENPKIAQYREQLLNANGYKQVNAIKSQALNDGIEIHDNGGFIAQAERQSVNSRVQGGAATMSKLAMIAVYNSAELKDLGFRMLLQVHDELIGECPIENAEEVSRILSDIMKHSAEPVVTIPFKTDTYQVPRWYWDDQGDTIVEEFNSEINSGRLKNDVFNEFRVKYSELTEEMLREILIDVYN